MKKINKFKNKHQRSKKTQSLLDYSPAVIFMILFPTTDNDRDDYFNRALAYTSDAGNMARLLLDAGKLATVAALIGPPTTLIGPPPGTNATPDTWNYVWPLIKNKDTATSTLRGKKDVLRTNIIAAFKDMYSDVPDSVITTDDTDTINIKPKSTRKDPTLVPKQITADDQIFVGLKAEGGGDLLFVCRSIHDSKRASKLNRNVDVEVYYGTVAPDVAPLTRSQCTGHVILTKSRDLFHLGDDAIGKKVCVFARWYYTKHPEKSGQFSTVATVVIG